MEHIADTGRNSVDGAKRNTSCLVALFLAATSVFRIDRDRRKLESVPDYLLKDMGIQRSDIRSVVRYGRKRMIDPD